MRLSLVLFLTAAYAQVVHQEPFQLVPSDPIDIADTDAPRIFAVSPDQWHALNASVGGRLFAGRPFARACFARAEGGAEGVDEEGCSSVVRDYKNETVRTRHASGMINTQWETCQSYAQTCLLDFADPSNPAPTQPPRECHQGSISNYYIKVLYPADIQSALAFSQEANVPLVIKNTGHDYKGRSSAPYSLGLWTHELQEMTYHPAFTPSCPDSSSAVDPTTAVTLGAGIQWFQAYAFAEEWNITLVGGADRTVGATGGWLQGGGHGALTNTMGMGADRVLEFTVVTPDGVLRTANACQNEDLFFALRGGGGGTFGVVLSATTRASPRVTIQAVLVQFPMDHQAAFAGDPVYDPDANTTTSNSGTNTNSTIPPSLTLTASLWSVLLTHAVPWAEAGWGAYITANSALYINPVLGKDDAQTSMAPLVSWAEELKVKLDAKKGKGKGKGKEGGVIVVQGEYDSWMHFYSVFADGNSADLGEPLALSSRLIPAHSLTPHARPSLLRALLHAEHTTPGVRLLKTTPFNSPTPALAPALHPAWRTAVFHVTAVAPWNWNASREEVWGRYVDAWEGMAGVRALTGGERDGAAYVNEADVYQVEHERTFWGDHYPRLLDIKNKYDPKRLLDCWHCVGWTSCSARYACYIDKFRPVQIREDEAVCEGLWCVVEWGRGVMGGVGIEV